MIFYIALFCPQRQFQKVFVWHWRNHSKHRSLLVYYSLWQILTQCFCRPRHFIHIIIIWSTVRNMHFPDCHGNWRWHTHCLCHLCDDLWHYNTCTSCFIWFRLLFWVTGMSADVFRQMVTTNEASVTEWAHKFLLPSMGSLMSRQFIRASKLTVTVLPCTNKWLLPWNNFRTKNLNW